MATVTVPTRVGGGDLCLSCKEEPSLGFGLLLLALVGCGTVECLYERVCFCMTFSLSSRPVCHSLKRAVLSPNPTVQVFGWRTRKRLAQATKFRPDELVPPPRTALAALPRSLQRALKVPRHSQLDRQRRPYSRSSALSRRVVLSPSPRFFHSLQQSPHSLRLIVLHTNKS